MRKTVYLKKYEDFEMSYMSDKKTILNGYIILLMINHKNKLYEELLIK